MLKKTFFITLLVFSAFSFAQNSGGIKGKVMDNEMLGEPLLFANISLKNTTFKTESNFHGNFEMVDVRPGQYTMEISYLGYETIEFPILVEADKVTFLEKGLNAIMLNQPALLAVENQVKLSTPSTSELRASRERE